MALFRWIADRLLGPPKRDVSRLETRDVDLIAENVDLSVGPLKPGQRHQTIRDRRLLPKRKASGFSPFKRKPLMEPFESGRLFSATHRTTNRNIRNLLADLEQLERLGLPKWLNELDLAQALGLSLPQLYRFASHRNREKTCHYVTFAIPKGTGGERQIQAPKRQLKSIQRQILTQVLQKLPPLAHAHGFCKGRSIRTGAQAHVGKAVVIKMDLKDFFPTVTFPRVRGLFIALGYSFPVATSLAVLTTECQRQPLVVDGQTYYVPIGPRYCVQGAPTSPAICNQIAAKLDNRLHGLARKLGFDYTRYADDLTFSGNDQGAIKPFLGLVRKIVQQEGFQIHPDKTKIRRQGSRQTVTGVVVNQVLGLSRLERRKIRAQLHKLSNTEAPDAAELRRVEGKLAYLAMLNPAQAEALQRLVAERSSD